MRRRWCPRRAWRCGRCPMALRRAPPPPRRGAVVQQRHHRPRVAGLAHRHAAHRPLRRRGDASARLTSSPRGFQFRNAASVFADRPRLHGAVAASKMRWRECLRCGDGDVRGGEVADALDAEDEALAARLAQQRRAEQQRAQPARLLRQWHACGEAAAKQTAGARRGRARQRGGKAARRVRRTGGGIAPAAPPPPPRRAAPRAPCGARRRGRGALSGAGACGALRRRCGRAFGARWAIRATAARTGAPL